MILVVCLNPALDVTHEVTSADWAGVNRPHAVHVRPGGKGVNVARTLRALGAPVTLTGLTGGATGVELADRLGGSGIMLALTQISGQTRRTFTVVDAGRNQAALFNEPGPAVGKSEFGEFAVRYEKTVVRCSAVVLAGSLPPGVGDGVYAGLIEAASAAGVPTVLDTSGSALALGAAAGPSVVKPNLAELAAAVGRELPDGPAVQDAARELSGGSGAVVVVSLGADGLLAVADGDVWLARPGEPVSGNATGAGDAVVAGLADGLARGLDWSDRLRHAVALGAAAVASPVAGEFATADYEYQYKLAQIVSGEGPVAAGWGSAVASAASAPKPMPESAPGPTPGPACPPRSMPESTPGPIRPPRSMPESTPEIRGGFPDPPHSPCRDDLGSAGDS